MVMVVVVVVAMVVIDDDGGGNDGRELVGQNEKRRRWEWELGEGRQDAGKRVTSRG